MPPKVFVSHASEDKKRFVVDFAHRLRENGVDAWLDYWEMMPGDSLVDKIFENGLKDAHAVIIVLSSISVQKLWVREELNASIVNRISRGTKLIPVIIDECEVPECLRSTLWQKIDNLDDYNESLQRILSAIFDINDKPSIGKPPIRFLDMKKSILELTRIDNLVFRGIARLQIEQNNGLVTFDKICSEQTLEAIPQEELLESLDILEQRHFIQIERVFGAPLSHTTLTNYGFREFAEAYIDDYQSIELRIAALMVNENIRHNLELANQVNMPCAFVDFILNCMESEKHIKVSRYMGGESQVTNVSASLRRLLKY